MPFCPKCGKEVSPEADYCPSCGANLRVDKDLLREKIAETRHNEMIFGIGSGISVVIGISAIIIAFIVGSVKATRDEWRGLTLYEVTYSPYANIAIAIAVLGIIMFLIALIEMIAAAYYAYQRSKLMKQLESSK